jgi:hypothetical protein
MTHRAVTLLMVALTVSSCASENPSRQYVDEDTAATIIVAGDSYVFARERPDLAVHAQDYATVTPVQVNRGGQRVLYLYCEFWSTIDRRGDKAILPEQSSLAIVADDRRFELPNRNSNIRQLGFGRAPIDAQKNAETRVLAIDTEWLHFMLAAAQVRIDLTAEGVTDYFLLWRSGRKSAEEFLRRMDTPAH